MHDSAFMVEITRNEAQQNMCKCWSWLPMQIKLWKSIENSYWYHTETNSMHCALPMLMHYCLG